MLPVATFINPGWGSLVESPDDNEIYINGIAHDAQTLAPKFSKTSFCDYVMPDSGPCFQFSKSMSIAASIPSLDHARISMQGAYRTVGRKDTAFLGSNRWLYQGTGRIISQSSSDSTDKNLRRIGAASVYQCLFVPTHVDGAGSWWGLTAERRSGGTNWAGSSSVSSAEASAASTYPAAAISTASVIYEDATKWIYVCRCTGTTNSTYVFKQVKQATMVAGVQLATLADVAATNSPLGMVMRPIIYNGIYYSYVLGENNNSIQVVAYNPASDTATITRVTISGTPGWVDSSLTGAARVASSVMGCFATYGGNRYLLVQYGRGQTAPAIASTYYAIYAYQLPTDPTQAITYAGKITFPNGENPACIIDMTTDESGKFVVQCLNDVRVFQYAGGSTFNLLYQYAYATSSIGVDFLGRLWMRETSTNNIYVVAPGQTVKINTSMQATSYSYQGTPISTNLIVNAINDSGTKVAKNVALSIDSGSMVFQANGLKAITITTNAGSDLDVPVTITGGGVFSITASEVA